jgi:hypothetical protein
MQGRIQLNEDEIKRAIQEYVRNRFHGRSKITKISINAQSATVQLTHAELKRRCEVNDFEED